MNAAEQQAWLQQLERRAAKAARQTLSPKDAAREEARIHATLHQKTVTWKVLRGVIEETEGREEAVAAKTKAVKKTEPAKPQAAQKGSERSHAATNTKRPATRKGGSAVTVDVEELESRIAASNLALRELEADLTEKAAWTAAKLEPLFDRLKTAVVHCNDLALFRDVVPKEQQTEMTKLETPKAAISQFGVCLVAARKRAKSPEFVGDDLERRAELTRLDAIAHGFKELAGK